MKTETMELGCVKVWGLRRLLLAVLTVVALWAVAPTYVMAAEETLTFSTPEKKELYRKMTLEMRCLKCQNQNLADSPAGLAEDLKREIFRMVEDDKSAKHIVDFMVARYGDFILYKPAFKPLTLVLWVAPFVLMLFGLFTILNLSRSRSPEPAVSDSDTNTADATNQSGDAAALARARELLQTPSPTSAQSPQGSSRANAVTSTKQTSR